VFEDDNATFEWNATFPLRTTTQITRALEVAGFAAVETREADSVFIARRAPES